MERRWESSMETWRRDLRQLAHGLQASSDSLHVLGSVCSDAAGEGASEHQGNIAVGGLGVTDWESEDLHAQVRSTLAMRKERGRLIGGMGPGELINRLFTIPELLQISDNRLAALERRRRNSSLSNTERSFVSPACPLTCCSQGAPRIPEPRVKDQKQKMESWRPGASRPGGKGDDAEDEDDDE